MYLPYITLLMPDDSIIPITAVVSIERTANYYNMTVDELWNKIQEAYNSYFEDECERSEIDP